MKYLKYLIGFFVVVVFGALLVRSKIESNTPPFLLKKLEQLKSDRNLMDSIGGFNTFQYSYNEPDFRDTDTVRFLIKISGHQHELLYNGIEIKNSSNNWELLRDSLLIIQ